MSAKPAPAASLQAPSREAPTVEARTVEAPTDPSGLPSAVQMSAGERAAAAEAYRAELLEEHERRVARVAEVRERSAARSARREQEERTRELNALKDEVKAKFYAEKGYRRYYDSTGRQLWLAPEEYELRMKRRKRRRRTFEPEAMGRTRTVLFYLGLLAVAVIMGFLLAR